MRSIILTVFLVLTILHPFCLAQITENSGSIAGVITDTNKDALPGVSIKMESSSFQNCPLELID